MLIIYKNEVINLYNVTNFFKHIKEERIIFKFNTSEADYQEDSYFEFDSRQKRDEAFGKITANYAIDSKICTLD